MAPCSVSALSSPRIFFPSFSFILSAFALPATILLPDPEVPCFFFSLSFCPHLARFSPAVSGKRIKAEFGIIRLYAPLKAAVSDVCLVRKTGRDFPVSDCREFRLRMKIRSRRPEAFIDRAARPENPGLVAGKSNERVDGGNSTRAVVRALIDARNRGGRSIWRKNRVRTNLEFVFRRANDALVRPNRR